MAKYRRELDDLLEEVAIKNKCANQKRFIMYRQFTWIKHGRFNTNVRHQLCECVQELILLNFPVEKGKRKRGYEEFKPNRKNGAAKV